jgi:A/G-specific adenine glycosylase
MLEVPNLAWRDRPYEEAEFVFAGVKPDTKWVGGESVRHVFTHFELRMQVFAVYQAHVRNLEGYHHLAVEALGAAALPSLMQKIIASGLAALNAA